MSINVDPVERTPDMDRDHAGDRPWTNSGLPVADRVEALLSALTLPEKVAQLSSAWEDAEPAGPEVAPGTSLLGVVGPLDQTARHGLGQLTRPYGTTPRTADEHGRLLDERQRQVMAHSRLGIPAVAHDECLTGFTAFGATIYPTSLGMAATFDPDLIRRVGAAIGADMAECGVHQGLAPVVDVIRDYRWGRCEETFGEDPTLVGAIGEAYVLGLQSAGVIATLKHFAGYSASVGGRNHAPVSMGSREFADVVLPPFERIVAAGVGSVMNSYAEVDGLAPAADVGLLTDLLRGAWGFTGTVVSDYWSLPFLVTDHRVATDWADAGAQALAAGLDVELPDQRGFGDRLVDKVRAGVVSEELVDRAVRRVLNQKITLGLLDPGFDPTPPGLRSGSIDLDKPASRALARLVAERSAVLVANDGGLPLPAWGRIAVIGPCADDVRTMFGCYSFPNHVLSDRPELGTGVQVQSMYEALAAELPDTDIVHAPGCPIREQDRSGIPAATRAATDADVAVVVVGDKAGMFGIGTSGEGCDVLDLALPGVQAELVNAVLATGTPVVLVVNSGRPYAIGHWAGEAAAIVQVFLPGEEGGHALAGLLSGRVDFSGRLPVSLPASPAGQPHTYLHKPLADVQSALSNLDPTPAWPFGHGLSYTTFQVTDLRTEQVQVSTAGEMTVTATIVNTGDRSGDACIQLYASDPLASVTRPVRWLVATARVPLAPGERADVTFAVPTDAVGFTGRTGTRIVEAGEVVLAAGTSSTDLPTQVTLTLTGADHPLPTPRRFDVATSILTPEETVR